MSPTPIDPCRCGVLPESFALMSNIKTINRLKPSYAFYYTFLRCNEQAFWMLHRGH